MNGPSETTAQSPTVARSCRVEGCSCQDSRIVSYRRAAFFAALARANGETADRQIAPEPAWRIPGELAADGGSMGRQLTRRSAGGRDVPARLSASA